MPDSTTTNGIQAIAEEAYIYAFPMLMGYRFAYATFLQPASPVYAGPANEGPYGEAVTLGPSFKDV
ncbi:MAG: cell envelope protein, partial [Actinomycetota bacterium]|nr:cell envelope protein [Actinomycetota bacterium]